MTKLQGRYGRLKNVKSKLLSLLLICVIAFSGVPHSAGTSLPAPIDTSVEVYAATAGTTYINNLKTASLFVGSSETFKVKTTKKVKWSSSNKKVAAVSNAGVVIGKKAGKATITAKVGSKKYNCKLTVNKIPTYKKGKTYYTLNKNKPYFFSSEKKNIKAFEYYSSLDSLDRCGIAYANICKKLFPTSERGEIGSVKPSGWHTVKYSFIDGKYLYNRCHLIAFMLAGENANEKNLITGTRNMNTPVMLKFENMIHDYVKETGNHVLYRVTPVFKGSELVARGVELEAWSVEDKGEGICFNVYLYNVQPGVTINYKTGDSSESGTVDNDKSITYILNTNTKKFHYPTCSSVNRMAEKNKKKSTKSRASIIADGYSPCGICRP